MPTATTGTATPTLDFTPRAAKYSLATLEISRKQPAGIPAKIIRNAGQAALDAGDLESADEYLSQAVDQFNKVELMWGRGIAFAYYGYLCFEQGEYRKALSLFIKADDYAQRLGHRHVFIQISSKNSLNVR